MSPNSGLTAEESQKAKRLYTNKCAKCHRCYDPSYYTATEWHTWMVKTNEKSKLTPEQESLLTRYLDLYRAARQSP